MKNFLGMAALMVLGAQSAMAVPTLKLTMTQASATTCSTMSPFGQSITDGTFTQSYLGGGVCQFTTQAGIIKVDGTYGTFNTSTDIAVGFPVQPMPAAWLNTTSSTPVASSIMISLVAFDYSNPTGIFNLISSSSGTFNPGWSYTISGYFDSGNSQVAGAGTLVFSDAGVASSALQSIAATMSTHVNNDLDGLYSVSWILTGTQSLNGSQLTLGLNGTFAQGAPAPGALALIGLGLLGFGALRRRLK